MAQTIVDIEDVPLETLEALMELMNAVCETFPEPGDAPEPLRSAMSKLANLWMESTGAADDDD
jgi:hypothetical protein